MILLPLVKIIYFINNLQTQQDLTTQLSKTQTRIKQLEQTVSDKTSADKRSKAHARSNLVPSAPQQGAGDEDDQDTQIEVVYNEHNGTNSTIVAASSAANNVHIPKT